MFFCIPTLDLAGDPESLPVGDWGQGLLTGLVLKPLGETCSLAGLDCRNWDLENKEIVPEKSHLGETAFGQS